MTAQFLPFPPHKTPSAPRPVPPSSHPPPPLCFHTLFDQFALPPFFFQEDFPLYSPGDVSPSIIGAKLAAILPPRKERVVFFEPIEMMKFFCFLVMVWPYVRSVQPPPPTDEIQPPSSMSGAFLVFFDSRLRNMPTGLAGTCSLPVKTQYQSKFSILSSRPPLGLCLRSNFFSPREFHQQVSESGHPSSTPAFCGRLIPFSPARCFFPFL